MTASQYDISYFEKHLAKGRLSGIPTGDRWFQFDFWKRYLVKAVQRHANVLEVGAGIGFFGKHVSPLFRYTGLDISFAALSRGKALNQLDNLLQASAVSLPIKDGSQHAIVAFDVVEHLEAPDLFLLEAFRVLRSEGFLILTMPNPYSFGVKRKRGAKTGVPSMLRDQTHVSLLSGQEWLDRLGRAGFSIVRSGTDGLWDHPYFENVPFWLQKAVFLPFSLVVTYFFGSLRWSLGENLVIVAKK